MRLNRFSEIYRTAALQIKKDSRPVYGSWDMHTHDYYECFLVTGRGGMHLLRKGNEPLLQDNLYFVRPEHAHGFRVDGKKQSPTFINLVLRFDVVESFLNRHPEAFPHDVWKPGHSKPAKLELAPGQLHEIHQVIDSLIYSPRSEINLEWFLSSLSRLLQPMELDLGRGTLPVWLRQGLHQFREPEMLRHGVQELVKHCHCTPEHLAREMKKHLGKRPVEWINDQKMRYATLLLQTTDLSITDVALEVGVNNLSHFHSLFKRAYGVTPRQYRLQALSPRPQF